jgi:CRP/FNR family transcriptional regulator, anaerobic regulatory protein
MQNKNSATVINIASIKSACKDCSLRELCLPLGLGDADLEALDKIIKRRHPLSKGEALYRYGDPLISLFAVRKGSIKTAGLMEDGRVQVTGFYFPGELLGIDAINTDQHPCGAEALEPTEVCQIPYQDLESLALKVPGLQHQLLRIMSREILRDEQMLMMLGRMTAEERLATCLLSFCQRHRRMGNEGSEFRLSMSRQDLGDYMGLALETVSRLFSRFQEEGLISAQGRTVRLLNVVRLQELAGKLDCGHLNRVN